MNFPKIYDANSHEKTIYSLWENNGAFTPSASGPAFSIVMPPPNSNGELHLGHALMVAIQDVVVRHRRLKGYSTLYLPGADHAGFETQVVYEKKLALEGKSRFDFSREELYRDIYAMVDGYRDNFYSSYRSWAHLSTGQGSHLP